ncbi:hypothetical protein G3480_14945 [Thiorhodococcus mannitoliphagus]|uniref:Tetratricopeptide repeat protein n=1 Tax=Thiorhodococcus mannitoliphagus TaxID=329406 RepID=A0A6P1DZK2_9GAMM|nr:hypothetical protein [Thiorhodococcus mannitoliphagus]NEX21592.1 hypothetical protein [Thiorhodococcus mannitoliphagus]
MAVAEEAHDLLMRARVYRESGQVARAQQKARAAMQAVRRGLRQHPKSIFLGRFLCGIYCELRDFGAAENCLEHLVAEFAAEPEIDLTEPYTRLGIIKWYRRMDGPAAIQYFHRALDAVRPDTDPDLASEPHLHLARIYLEIQVPERAREHVDKRLEAVRDCPQAAILYELAHAEGSFALGVGAAV